MLEEGRSHEEIFTQLAATKAALDRIGVLLVSRTMRECLCQENETAATSPEAVERALEAFLRYAQAAR